MRLCISGIFMKRSFIDGDGTMNGSKGSGRGK